MTTRRIHSFVWSGIAAAIFLTIGIGTAVSNKNATNIIFWGIVAIMAFSFISCLILDNNFIGDMVLDIWGWGFIKLPGLIFTLDLDGIIWLITVKLLFWVLGIVLATLCGLLALIIGSIVSVFVYPFAIYKDIKEN
jgi:hypothetical protein